MKSIHKALSLVPIVALAIAFASAPCAFAQETVPAATTTDDTTITVSAGGQTVDGIDKRGEARFEEFREVPSSAVIDFAHIAYAPEDGKLDLNFTAFDAGQDDQRYGLDLVMPGKFAFRAGYQEILRTYSTGSTTLFSGIGTGDLTIDNALRQGAEDAAGDPKNPFASPALASYMNEALAHGTSFDLGTKRKNLAAGFDYTLVPGLTLNVSARDEQRDGTRPFGFGTYIRRQALANTPGTGSGKFWRETVEARGVELIEPLQYDTTEYAATLTWVKNGNSASAGVFASEFRNDITSLYFDNPFEGGPGRASAIVFDPKAEQEPASPNGNNNLRGLTARSSMQLAPDNDYQRIFGTLSLRLPAATRLNATVAIGTMEQNDPFMPYSSNPFVVFSGKHGEPGVVYAIDAPLPQDSLNGEMNTTQGDVRLTTRLGRSVNLRAGLRYYELEDDRPSILFPGFASSGDSYFRPGIGQRDANGNRVLFNQIGGYTRERVNLGAAWRLGRVTLDGEIVRTGMDYEERQVESTTDDSFRATVRVPVGDANINAFYLVSSRDFDGAYHVGLEASGVRAFDVWKRDRDQFGADFEVPIGENVVAGFGASYVKDEYPGAVAGFAYGWGMQDSSSASVYTMANYSTDRITLGASAGIDRYDINSLQVTKTGLKADYDPTNRWTRESEDDVVWVALEALIPISESMRWNTAVDFQRFTGTWDTTNLGTPDVNSAVAYDYPELSDDTISLRTSFVWEMSSRWGFEVRYWYEPYDLDDFTTDIMSPYMQGALDETRSNPSDVGPMNVSRFLFLDSRTTDYDASVASALIHFSY